MDALIRAVETATTDEEKLEACAKLNQLPATAFPDALEAATLMNDRGLTLVAKALLIRWAAENGDEATDWAWNRFRSEGLWVDAFREIGPAWAAHRPGALGKWAMLALERTKAFGNSITIPQAEASDAPLLETGMITNIAGWLVTEDPHLAYRIIVARGGFSSLDITMPLSLHSAAKVREALLAFDQLDQMDPVINKGTELAAKCLLMRWNELDPEDFSRSPYTRLVDSAAPAKMQSSEDSENHGTQAESLVRSFDIWTKAHPGERRDLSGWPPARRQVWEDLEALLSTY